MGKTLSLGNICGIELRADFSWLIGFGLFVWVLAANYFPNEYPEWTPDATIWAAIATTFLIYASIVTHELGHSLVSNRLGLPVSRITLFILGGLSHLNREPDRPKQDFLIAAAGPMASLLLALGFSSLILTGPGVAGVPLAAFGKLLGVINLGLALFNLLPGLPLDGGRILRAILWARLNDFHKATQAASVSGQLVAFGLILWGFFLFTEGSWGDGLWIAYLGWFIQQAATQTQLRLKLQARLAGHSARKAMRSDYPRVKQTLTIQQLADMLLIKRRQCAQVGVGKRTIGMVTLQAIRAIPYKYWTTTPVSAAMIPFKELKSVSPDTGLFEVITQMAEANLNQLAVVEDGQLVGVIGRDNILSYLQARVG
jgi:Zn-dependent protease